MRIHLLLAFLFMLYLSLGVFYSNINLKVTPAPTKNENSLKSDPQFFDYSGVINVHTKKSSGGASVQEVIKAASKAELDFLFFHEEAPLGRKQPPAINFGKLTVFYGLVLNYEGASILYTDIENDKTFTSNSEVQVFLADYFDNGGEELLILAHPEKPSYQWEGEKPNYISGLEVLNLREVWRQAWKDRTFSFLNSLLFYPFNPSLFFLDIYSNKVLSKSIWKKWNSGSQTPVYGFLGSDVTSKLRIYQDTYLNFPGYKSIFDMAKNHILLDEELLSQKREATILEALKKGQFYFSIDIFGSPEGFAFFVETKDKKKHLLGSQVTEEEAKHLAVTVPESITRLKVELYKNGEKIKTFSDDFTYDVKKAGVYHIEVKVKPRFPIFRSENWVPWILSNPIQINENQN